ncbi:RagB/SusD family nutrient uptake outer membrane protein [Labilibaculum manganireducens]|uniref:RagB/SusD family nutrient uptake outer membrane protein n=1 Tax=Labilibaculum manganireducens TaxID=1940525 RepID=UPI0029F49934|nr:RagB/SusD family nutrient uptake outer membrane protein [Labilibaculum manganireducens]
MKKIIYTFILISLLYSCDDFVDIVPKGNTIPETVDDLSRLMNLGTFTSEGDFTEISFNIPYFELYSDDYTITQDELQPNFYLNTIPIFASYLKWSDSSENSDEKWDGLYKSNYVANYVLDKVDNVAEGVANDRNEVKGRALVHRAMNYFLLVNLYGKQYDASAGSASTTDLGVPLILESDINKQYQRATVAKVYEQILDDLTQAISIMKTEVSEFSNIPSLSVAFALRARVYLWMQNYDQAYTDAVKATELNGDLIDYNTCSQAVPSFGSLGGIIGYPTPAAKNSEVIYARFKSSSLPVVYTEKMLGITDTDNDLRYTLFSYFQSGVLQMFYNNHNHSGINAAEVWLIRAEAALRKPNPTVTDAIFALDYVRVNRFKQDAYEPTELTNTDALLDEILNERRREIRLNEMAFFDRKRLNANPATAKPMSRVVQGMEYTLPVGSPKYQLLIPVNVMQLNPLLIQNER